MDRFDIPVPMNGEILESGMQVTKEYKVRFDVSVLQQIATRTDFPFCESEPIIFYDSKWIIRVFPNGFDVGTIDKVKVVLLGMSETNVKVEYKLYTSARKMVLIDKTVANISKTSSEKKVSIHIGSTQNLLIGASQSSNFISSEGRFELQLTLSKTDENETKFPTESNIIPSLFRGHLFHKATSDVDIVLKGTRIPAHKLILSLVSPVFTSMFENQMQESVSNEIVISDFSEELVRSMLRCIYDGDAVTSKMIEHADQLLFIANKYELKGLEIAATNHIIDTLHVDNAIHVLQSADVFNRKNIKSAAMEFIVANADLFFDMLDFVGTVCIALMNELLGYMIANKHIKLK